MQIDITGNHIELTDALRDYVRQRFVRLERHYEDALDAHVILREETPVLKKAEATIHVAGHTLFAHAEDKDLYAAIDALADKLDRQLVKTKEKQTNHHRNGRVRP